MNPGNTPASRGGRQAAGDPLKIFHQALCEEEAIQNLDAAIEGYEQVLQKLEAQRKLAAATLFRLGESDRKKIRPTMRKPPKFRASAG